MIRAAKPDDIEALVRMARSFYATTHYSAIADFCVRSTVSRLDLLLEHGVVLVAEDPSVVGMVGLMLGPSICNDDVIIASELMWWVDPSARKTGAGVELLDAVAPACKEAGAVAVQMALLETSPPLAAQLYDRAGYSRTETYFTKRL